LGYKKEVKQRFLGVSIPFVRSGSLAQVEFNNHIVSAQYKGHLAFEIWAFSIDIRQRSYFQVKKGAIG
jgi:hypothetical protein